MANIIKLLILKYVMKRSAIILYVTVALSLIFSLTALIIATQNNNNVFVPNSPTNTPYTPEPQYTEPTTSTAQPTATPSETNITINYTETNREENNGMTKVTLTVDITYENGDPVTINYSQLHLELYVGRNVLLMPIGTAAPNNSGSFTLEPTHKTQTLQLNFEFSTISFNGMDYAGTIYQLGYNGSATVQWENREYK